MDIRSRIDLFLKGAFQAQGSFDEKVRRGKELEEQISQLKRDMLTLDQCGKVFSSLLERSQSQMKDKIEALVSYSLSKVFERDLKFHLIFKEARHQLAVEFMLSSIETGGQPVRLTESRGGGICEVAGFVLRLLFLLLTKDQRKILILDEPFSWVSEQYMDNLISLIRELSEMSGIQFIVVTHNAKLAEMGDKRYSFALKDGKTHVQELT